MVNHLILSLEKPHRMGVKALQSIIIALLNPCRPDPEIAKAGAVPVSVDRLQTKKPATGAGSFSGIWWRRGESNPRPRTI